MNIDNALVMLYKKELLTKDIEKEIYKLIPYKITKGYIENNTFYTYDSEEDNTACYNSIEHLDTITDGYVYAFTLNLEQLSEELSQNFNEDYEEFEKFFNTQEFFYINNLSDNTTKTLTRYEDNIELVEVNMQNFKNFLEIFDKVEEEKEKNKLMNTDELFNIVTSSVKCQDEQIKEIITNIVKNQRIENSLIKSNMLICGPTGVGKTKVFDILLENTNIPVVFEEASDYHKSTTPSINQTLLNLYLAADNNLERAQKGVIVIDNLDFNCINYENFMSNFMQEFKKHLIGEIYMIQTPTGEYQSFNTSNLTFVLIGNFMNTDLYNSCKIGYKYNPPTSITDEKIQKRLSLYPEFNNDNIIIFNNLNINDLITIIKESKTSDLLLYKKLLNNHNINLVYDDTLIEAIAQEAYKLNLGATGVKRIVEKLFKDANYYIFSTAEYKELIIDKETIKNNKKYTLR